MDVTETDLAGVLLIKPQVFEDSRGQYCLVFRLTDAT